MTDINYGEDEREAVRDTLDAITMGMVRVAGSVDDDAAMERLQNVLDVLNKHHGINANHSVNADHSVSHFGRLTSSAAGTEELSPARTTAG